MITVFVNPIAKRTAYCMKIPENAGARLTPGRCEMATSPIVIMPSCTTIDSTVIDEKTIKKIAGNNKGLVALFRPAGCRRALLLAALAA